VDPIRVLIADMPGILRGVVRHSLETHDDFEVVEDLGARGSLAAAVERTGAHVVVVDAAHPEARSDWPAVALLAVAADGRKAWRVQPLGELSPEALANAVRSAVTAA